MLSRLTPIGAMTDNSPVEARTTLDRLRVEAGELRASRKRLVLAADADRRSIERELHDGVQQHLVALAVNLQLASRLTDTDPRRGARRSSTQMARDVQQALDETAQLAQRIYPPLLEAGGLAAALRAAARAHRHPRLGRGRSETRATRPRSAATIYWCCLEALEHAPKRRRPSTVRTTKVRVAFEIVGGLPSGLDVLRDRVEALGGQLLIRPEPAAGRASPARCRSRDDASRSPPGRGSRP